MEVTLDKYGRIVIPKSVRDHLGIEAGSVLAIEVQPSEEGGVVQLRPSGRAPALQRKGGVLVHTGRADEPLDVVESIRQQRTKHAQKAAGDLPLAGD